jgi:hypothetical protein
MRTVTGMQGIGSAQELAELLRQMGRGDDSMLAHITPEEAEMLMQAGGSGTINPNTGLPEFQPRGDYDFDLGSYQDVAASSPDIYGFGYNQPGEVGFRPPAALTPEFRGPSTIPQVQPDYTPFYQRSAPPPGGMPEAPFSAAEIESRFRGAPKPVGPALATQPPPGMSDRVAQTLRESPNLRNLLATGAASLPALLNAARMQRETRRAANELRQLGAPIRQQAEELRQQATSGGLTPQQARQMEAQRARMLQSGSQRGVTTGTQQAMIENQLTRQRAELGQTNLENALRQLNMANAYDEAAIRAKLAGDRDTAMALEEVLSNLIRSYAGMEQQPSRQRSGYPLPPDQMATQLPQVPGR